MAKPNVELDSPRVAMQGEGPDGATTQPPTAEDPRADRPGSLSAIGWRIFGAMRRGWVILILSLLGWAVLVATVLAIVSLF